MSNSRSEFRFIAIAIGIWLAFVDANGAEVDPHLRAQVQTAGDVDVLLVLAEQSRPVLPLPTQADSRTYRRALADALQARAQHAQRDLRGWLDARRIEHRDFWIANLIQARVPVSALAELAMRSELLRIDANPVIALQRPIAQFAPASTLGIAWGVEKIEAPQLWAAGYTGQGVVIGGEDTGYQWNHPALKAHYRGWNGTSADHNYNWHDSIHDSVGNPCNNNAQAPCDDDGHGTHTAGTFAGDDGAGNQIGVAPGARWIGCRNMDQGNGTPARYIECMQWLLAPTDLAGNNANPDLAPDIVSNSWGCPAQEGCATGLELQGVVDTLVDSGIFYVVAAGNDGSSCSTILDAPAVYDASFVVGATGSSDVLASFSSRGPVAGSVLIRPDVSAPGVGVNSSYPVSTYQLLSGTSMAAPHVAGAAALLMSAFPALRGKPREVASILRETAMRQGVTDSTVQSCGGTSRSTWPNNMIGSGRIDVGNAYRDIIFIDGLDD